MMGLNGMSYDERVRLGREMLLHRKRVLSHPLVSRYLQRAESGATDFRMDPKDIIAEKIFMVGRTGWNPPTDGKDIAFAKEFRELSQMVRTTETILWSSEATKSALSARVADNALVPFIPESGLWFSFEHGAIGNIIALAYFKKNCGCDTERGAIIEICFKADECHTSFGGDCGFTVLKHGPVHEGDSVNMNDPADKGFPSQLVKMKAFLDSPYIPTRIETAGWMQKPRRGIKRVHKTEDVRFVYMREPLHEKIDDYSGVIESRSYRSKWLVRGHLRNQWYPSKQSHRLIFVPPYVKGPSDATMIQKVGMVVR